MNFRSSESVNMGDTRAKVTIFDVLGVDICRRMILDPLHINEILRSETVSRRWQREVHNYLQLCHNLTWDFKARKTYPSSKSSHRVVQIPYDYCLPVLYKSVEKLGSSIVSLSTDRNDKLFYECIASNCINLRHIELNGLSLGRYNVPEQTLVEIFWNKEWETIKLLNCENLFGISIQNIKSDRLISLSINECPSLGFCHLNTISVHLRNVTNLELNKNSSEILQNVHLLLKKMPKLEDLSLCDYNATSISEEFVESFKQLANLKRLNLNWNRNVDDDLLVTLAQECRPLEYINIAKSMLKRCSRGLAALIQRNSPAVTSLCLGFKNYFNSYSMRNFYRPMFEEMEAYGCKKVTMAMWEEAGRDAWKHGAIVLRLGQDEIQTMDFHPELKIILF